MKRLITLTFTACLFNSLAFADNPTDAPLMSSITNPPAAKKQTRAAKHHRHDKKEERRSLRGKSEGSSNRDGQPEQSNREYPPTANN
jgi:hypothetical protein